ncbi:hypothetical protein D3C78_1948850 [compost metagenome]
MAGGSVAGWLFDLYRSYTLSIVLTAGCALLSAVAVLLASRAACGRKVAPGLVANS